MAERVGKAPRYGIKSDAKDHDVRASPTAKRSRKEARALKGQNATLASQQGWGRYKKNVFS